MAGIAKPNIPTSGYNVAAALSRGLEVPDAAFSDTNGDGSYNSYLGCNRAGSNAPGIGIASGLVYQTAAELAAGERFEGWTELDQNSAARIPQDTALIGNGGYVNRGAVDWPSSGGSEGNPTLPIVHVIQPASVPGVLDVTDPANLVVADTAAADGAVMDTSSGAVNQTGAAVAIGDLVWGNVPT